MRRKDRFLFGFFVVTAILELPMTAAASVKLFQWAALLLVSYLAAVYKIYRITIRNIRPKCPIASPTEQAYAGRMPRPIYEDTEQYPWFFKKKEHRQKGKQEPLARAHY